MNTDIYLKLKNKTLQKMHEGISPEKGNILNQADLFAHSDLMILTHEFEANNSSFHGHDFFEINYVLTGICHQNLDRQKEITLKRGNVCIMNPNAMHSCTIESECDAVINLLVRTELINNIFMSFTSENTFFGRFFLQYMMPDAKNERDYLLFENKFDPYTDFLIERIAYESLEQIPYSAFNQRNLLSLLLSHLLETSLNKSSGADLKTEQMIEYISSHIQNVSLQTVADHFHMHPNYLSSYIKKNTGKNYAEIVSNIRLTQAQNLLANTPLSIDAISEQLGYADSLSFYNMFKRITGITPSKYRKQQQMLL